MRQKLILLVEDDADTREVYEIFFKGLGHRIATVADGRSALAAVREERPDLVLLDIDLPDLSGVEVLRRLRDAPETCLVPVLVLTAHALPAEIERLGELECDGILTKPCDLAELCAAVLWLLDAALPSIDRQVLSPAPFRRPKIQYRSRGAAHARGPRDLQALVLWADFLYRESIGLQERAAALIARAVTIRTRSRRLIRSYPKSA